MPASSATVIAGSRNIDSHASQITRSSVVNNVNTGVLADGSATSVALLSNTLVSGNGTGLASAGGAQLDTYKNNSVNGNTTDGTFTTQITPQ